MRLIMEDEEVVKSCMRMDGKNRDAKLLQSACIYRILYFF